MSIAAILSCKIEVLRRVFWIIADYWITYGVLRHLSGLYGVILDYTVFDGIMLCFTGLFRHVRCLTEGM